MKKIVYIILLLLPFITFAQFQRTNSGNLTIFSEDGDKFYLVLNGEKQNDEPQTNIRIEELTQPYYSAKIIFEDKSLSEITKKNLLITDADGVFMDVTYKIKKDKNKKVKLNYFSMTNVQPDFVPPSNMYVHQFGSPAVSNNQINQVPRSNNNSNGSFGASVNMPGVNMNITINDPGGIDMNQSSQMNSQTTQQSSTRPQSSSRGCNGAFPMSLANFNEAKNTISKSNFDDTKLTTAKSIVSNNCLTSDQVVSICNLFSFEENKLAFAKYAYIFTTDPRNYFKVNNVFSFSSNKEELSEFIQQGGN